MRLNPGEMQVQRFRAEVLGRFLLIGTALSFVVMPVYAYIGNWPLTLVSAAFFLVTAGLCHMHHAVPRARPWCAHVFVAISIAVTLTGLGLGDEAFDNKPWQLLIPLLAFLLTGSRDGLRWTGVAIAGVTLVLAARWAAYEPVTILIFFVVYATLAYSLLVFTQWNEANLRAIERLSYTDSLTQVYNRQLFDQLCEELLARVRKR